MANLQDITKLREMTGAGMMDCKNALDEAENNVEKASEILRKKGIIKAAKRADKIAAEGITVVKSTGDTAVVLEVNSETDFAAKNDTFKVLSEKLADTLLKSKSSNLEEAMKVEVENGQSVEDYITEMSGKIGEKITLRRFEIMTKEDSQAFGVYSHMQGKISVLVLLSGTGDDSLAYDVAMHAAAANPKCLNSDEVSVEDMEKEKEIYKVQLLKEGKPENMIENILQGKMKKYYSEYCLVNQHFIKDESKSVEQYVKEKGGENAKVEKFVRYELGAGIEKGECDYLAEVAEQLNK